MQRLGLLRYVSSTSVGASALLTGLLVGLGPGDVEGSEDRHLSASQHQGVYRCQILKVSTSSDILEQDYEVVISCIVEFQ